MKKLNNPFVELDGYNCFGCNPDNKYGLRMTFFEQDNMIISQWDPKPHFQGWGDVLHGGIQSTLMDEIASWVVFIKLKTAGVTSKMEVRFHKPAYTTKGEISLRAFIKEMNKNTATIAVELRDSKNILCSDADIDYFTYPPNLAKKKFLFPDYDKFVK